MSTLVSRTANKGGMEFFRVEGDWELMKLFWSLPESCVRRALRAGIAVQARKMGKTAKKIVRKDTKTLAKSLGVKIKVYPKAKTVVGLVGPRRGFERAAGARLGSGRNNKVRRLKPVDPVRYAHLVEKGHEGPSPAPAHPFLKPAYDLHVRQTPPICMTKVKEVLKKEAAKQAAKVRK